MCILFMYNGTNEEDSEYSLILASNRDEFYDRASQNMAPWVNDPSVIAGRDLDADCDDSTWLAFSPVYRKIGVLLNLQGTGKENAKSRGKLAADYAKTDKNTKEYIDHIKDYTKECNEFIFVTVEFQDYGCSIASYNNATNELASYTDTYVGISNSLPKTPYKKVEAGKTKMMYICRRLNKINKQEQLIEELINLLKSDESHLPDHLLEKRRPKTYKQLSSIFVYIPEVRYGTRTHTLILVTKKGHVTVVENTMRAPIDVANPTWDRTEFQFDINSK